ncbi:MAG TPA: peptidylprolyl isomerase [Propionibacteriaceae bacterium]|nr:peptidylprolyl isomerase [Propionibacteriaceae bacterium]
MRISAVLSASLLVAAALTGCQAAQEASAPLAPGRDCSYLVSGSPVRAVDPPDGSNVAKSGTVTMTLDMAAGPVVITMDRAKAPCAVNSFESLVQQQYFDQSQCHRLVDEGIFILQCGDPSATGRGGPGYSFADELTGNETYPKGTVAMANAGPNTNGSQFFLCWEDSPLPPKYTVFGTLDEASLDTVIGIASQGINPADMTSPQADASITAVTLG